MILENVKQKACWRVEPSVTRFSMSIDKEHDIRDGTAPMRERPLVDNSSTRVEDHSAQRRGLYAPSQAVWAHQD